MRMPSPDVLVALFQGFVLQHAWGEEPDVEACLHVVDRMLGGLEGSRPEDRRSN